MPNAQNLHNDALVIDTHNDTIVTHIRRGNISKSGGEKCKRHNGTVAYLRGPLDRATREQEVQINFSKMQAGGINAAFFAVDVTRAWKNHLSYALDAFGFFNMEAADNNVIIARSAADIQRAKSEGKLAAILVIENSDGTERSLNILHMLHQLGVRSIGLTHDPTSWAAAGNGETDSKGGLTKYGIALVKEMNNLGMLVDISHISEHGFWNVIDIAERPVIASHSCCKTLCGHPRNLTDEQIKALAQNGGSMGVTFVPRFVAPKEPTFQDLIDHIDHAVQLVGPNHVGIGSDFDGGGTLIKDATVFPQFTEELLNRNYSEEDIHKILGENHLRVIKEAIG